MRWQRFLSRFGAWWDRVERRLHTLRIRFRRQRRELKDEAKKIGEDLWDLVDDLPFVPELPRIRRVRRQYYGHGAFMGAAPALMADTNWRRILAFLMPDVYSQVTAAIRAGANAPKLIPMFENNPVMCAYGVHEGHRFRKEEPEENDEHDLAGHEWDVFVNSALVEDWENASDEQRLPIIAKIVDSMLIAHASTTDTVQEAIGICQYEDVRKTPKTALGGVEPQAWLDLFSRALRLAAAPDLSAAIRQMSTEPRVETEEECRKYTFASPASIPAAVETFRRLTGREQFSIMLEIKSLRSTSSLLGALVQELNRRHIHVVGVGSFLLDEIRGVSEITQVLEERLLPGPREVLFLHFAGDLQHGCLEGTIPSGQSVMFNGASLLDASDPELGPVQYALKDDVIADLAKYRDRFELAIGLYVQEGDCDAAAAGLLSELVHRESGLFSLGFAWGALPHQASFDGAGADHRGYGGQKLLEYVGKAKQWEVRGDSIS